MKFGEVVRFVNNFMHNWCDVVLAIGIVPEKRISWAVSLYDGDDVSDETSTTDVELPFEISVSQIWGNSTTEWYDLFKTPSMHDEFIHTMRLSIARFLLDNSIRTWVYVTSDGDAEHHTDSFYVDEPKISNIGNFEYIAARLNQYHAVVTPKLPNGGAYWERMFKQRVREDMMFTVNRNTVSLTLVPNSKYSDIHWTEPFGSVFEYHEWNRLIIDEIGKISGGICASMPPSSKPLLYQWKIE